MPNYANDPSKKSWLEIKNESDFPIQNIPFGVFITKEDVITIGTRIGDYAIDMGALQQQLIKISREMIDNNKKCYLAAANKEQLKTYYDKTEQCKDMLEQVRIQINSYAHYIKTLE